MSARSSTPLIVTVLVIIAIAVVIRYAGPAIWNTVASLHGGGGGH